jgi:hypothetical protein
LSASISPSAGGGEAASKNLPAIAGDIFCEFDSFPAPPAVASEIKKIAIDRRIGQKSKLTG